MRLIPPLNPLRAFESAARCGSISKAAEELHVTATAISRQVRILEEYLGVQLFVRKPSSLELSPAGRSYSVSLSRAFGEIARATGNLKSSSKEFRLSVRSYTTFMVKWLLPRLPTFQLENPDVHIRISTGFEPVDFENSDVDIWIRYGRGRWPGMRCQPVFYDRLRPFSAVLPKSDMAMLRTPESLFNQVLLRHSRRQDDWDDWFAHQGLVPPLNVHMLEFDDLALIFEAAASGLGIGITQEQYLLQDVRAGRFFWPFDAVLERSTGYFAVQPEAGRMKPEVKLFLDWLESESARAVR